MQPDMQEGRKGFFRRKGKTGVVLTKIANATLIIITLLVLIFTLVLHARFSLLDIAITLANSSFETHIDFDIFWHSATALWDGRDIYVDTGALDNNLNPPIFTVLFSPFGLLEALIAYRLFVLLMLLMSAGSLA